MSKQDAVTAAAAAVRAHQAADADTVTLRDMEDKVQAAQNQGATLADIAAANRATR